MPPSPSGTSYLPMETLSPSHLPGHATHFRPMASSFCTTVLFSFLLAGVFGLGLATVSSLGVTGVEGMSGVETGGRFVVGIELFQPGCLKMPKLSDFFSGWMLHAIVCPPETWSQRTRYAYKHRGSQFSQLETVERAHDRSKLLTLL